ncbi:MAG: EAL domain-containing protein [Spongiibacteraceae bacterium]
MQIFRAPRQTLITTGIVVTLITIIISLVLRQIGAVNDVNNPASNHYVLQLTQQLDSDVTLLADAVQAEFEPITEQNKAMGFGRYNHWYKVVLTNATNDTGHLRLLLDNPTFDHLTIYQVNSQDEIVRSSLFGDKSKNIDVDKRILPNIAFELASRQSTTLYVHAQTRGSPIISLKVMTENIFQQYERSLHLIWGAFIGITLIIGAYNAVLYAGIRDNVYLYYISYLISVFLMIGVIHGFGYYFFPEGVQLWFSQQVISLQTLVALNALTFGKKFLKIQPDTGLTDRIVNGVIFLLVIFFFASLFIEEYRSASVFVILQILTYGAAALMIAYQFRTRYRWTRYYLISWVPFFYGAAIGMGLFIGALDYNFHTRHTFIFSILFELTFMSMALADRMSEAERKRLFLATHNMKTKLANEFYIEYKLSEFNHSPPKSMVALIAIKVSNYDHVVPYLTEDNRRRLLRELTHQFSQHIDGIADLLYLDSHTKTRVSVLNDNTFFFLAQVEDERQFKQLTLSLSEQDNFNPLQDTIPFRIQCIVSARLLGDFQMEPQLLLNSVKEGFNSALEEGQPLHIYSQENEIKHARGIKLAQDLEVAIKEDQLQLYYQPQLPLFETDALYSEVLLRWTHADLGVVPPSEFVLIAEQTGIIRKLTIWVIEEAFREYCDIVKSSTKPLTISINISAMDLSRKGFALDVIQLAQKHAVTASNFTLEVTETSHHQDQHVFHNNLAQLKQAGFYLAIDDFGTGYSSLTYVSDLPFDELKIDRSFVKDMATSERQRQIVNATIGMAISLGLSVTAEGIEDEATLLELKKVHCHKIQGYYYEKPMPFENYKRWLAVH